MKKSFLVIFGLIPIMTFAQLGIGIKAGLNFANISKASDISSSSQAGFMAGVFLAPPSKGVLSSRTEIIYSKQGYSFKSGSNTGKVNLDYIILPQLMGINITKIVQLQLGMQMAYLLNAKADSTDDEGESGPYSSVMSNYNKFDYAFAVGAEIHPVSGLVLGARYNIGLGKIYKEMETGQSPSFTAADAKNNVVQVFVGWIFGKNSSGKNK